MIIFQLINILCASLLLWAQPVIARGIYVNVSSPIATVEPFFLSFTLDAHLINRQPRWGHLDFHSEKLRTLMSGLSPALLRFGGSSADHTIFTKDLTSQDHLRAAKTHLSATAFTHDDLDNLINISRSTGTKFLFDLDLHLRYGSNWDPTNAMEMMRYIELKGYGDSIDFELGNEPDLFHKADGVYSAKQIGADFVSLIKLVRSFPCLNASRIVGPDVAHLDSTQDIFKEVVDAAGDQLSAATFHNYYMKGDHSSEMDLLDIKYFAEYDNVINIAKSVVAKSKYPKLSIWNGETADACHSGIPHVTDRFISSFLWLDKLGVSARQSISVVARQDLYGPNYGLLDDDMNPNPDYWASWMHKQLVGTRVLNVTATPTHPNTTRLYAHCSRPMHNFTGSGSVTMFALNFHKTLVDTLYFDVTDLQAPWGIVFVMTAPDNDLLSKYVALNGKVLKMVDNATMPDVRHYYENVRWLTAGVNIPPLSFVFIAMPDAGAKACN